MTMDTKGQVIWLTGLSGAGKTTLAFALSKKLADAGFKVESLDGDEIRETLSKGLGFSKEDRDANIRRIGFVSRLLARNGVTVLTAAISPYRDLRDEIRRTVEADGARFVEVFVRCPLAVLIERDVKGLYKKALAGEIEHFTGVSDPYEDPLRPDVVVDSSIDSVEESAAQVFAKLSEYRGPVGKFAQARADMPGPLDAPF